MTSCQLGYRKGLSGGPSQPKCCFAFGAADRGVGTSVALRFNGRTGYHEGDKAIAELTVDDIARYWDGRVVMKKTPAIGAGDNPGRRFRGLAQAWVSEGRRAVPRLERPA